MNIQKIARAVRMGPKAVAELLDEVDTLRETLRQYQDALQSPGYQEELRIPEINLPFSWRLSALEKRYLLALQAVAPRTLTFDTAMWAMYGTEPWPTYKVLDVRMVKLRQKVRGAGIQIESVRAEGHRLGPESLCRLNEYIAAEQRLAADLARQSAELASQISRAE